MRKHPIILGIFLLSVVGMLSFIFAYVFGAATGGGRFFNVGERVGIIPIEGIISDSEEVVAQIQNFSDDQKVRAVVLRVNSPGGGVAPSQEIYQAVLELKKKKKVVVSMGSVAASGGYLIAVAADRILANPGTITGSISAVIHYANAEELMKKIGVSSYVIKSGKFKDIGSPTRKMTEEERTLIQAIVDDIYDQFVQVIALNRKIPLQNIQQMADGRVFSGRQAKERGLVDGLGGLQDAVVLAGRLAGMEGKPETVYGAKKKEGFLSYLSGSMAAGLFKAVSGKSADATGAFYLLQ
jgi:protease-4